MADRTEKKDSRANLKIPSDLRYRLKVYATRSRSTMEELAEAALEQLLSSQGSGPAKVSHNSTHPTESPFAVNPAEDALSFDKTSVLGRIALLAKEIQLLAEGEPDGDGPADQEDLARSAPRRRAEIRARAFGDKDSASGATAGDQAKEAPAKGSKGKRA